MCSSLSYLQALGPSISAIVAACALIATIVIARKQNAINARQANLNAEKLRLELFEKRLAAYAEFESTLHHAMISPVPDRDILFRSQYEMRKYRWLFGSEVMSRFEELVTKAFEKRASEMRIESGTDATLTQQLDRIDALNDWFNAQTKQLDELFGPYLRFEHLRDDAGKS